VHEVATDHRIAAQAGIGACRPVRQKSTIGAAPEVQHLRRAQQLTRLVVDLLVRHLAAQLEGQRAHHIVRHHARFLVGQRRLGVAEIEIPDVRIFAIELAQFLQIGFHTVEMSLVGIVVRLEAVGEPPRPGAVD
jgi:hypothetical protein